MQTVAFASASPGQATVRPDDHYKKCSCSQCSQSSDTGALQLNSCCSCQQASGTSESETSVHRMKHLCRRPTSLGSWAPFLTGPLPSTSIWRGTRAPTMPISWSQMARCPKVRVWEEYQNLARAKGCKPRQLRLTSGFCRLPLMAEPAWWSACQRQGAPTRSGDLRNHCRQ